ncbi:MAG: hypothetical protein CL458_06280 [Acidimicrobiaceae bacterium]|nr:hypothetical protein [Acidimicrobiaceae bacterium]
MVAVLRAEVEELDRSYMNYRERPQLQLIAGIPESFVADPETVSSRRSQSTYWRRRLTCLALVVGAAWLVVNVAGDLLGVAAVERPLAQQTVFESAAGETLTAGQIVIVKPGDTLWSIARKLQPTGDLRPLVDRIAKINNGHSLIAGQALLLP